MANTKVIITKETESVREGAIQNIMKVNKDTANWNLDEKEMKKAYNKIFRATKKTGKTDRGAEERAEWFINYYSHQFKQKQIIKVNV